MFLNRTVKDGSTDVAVAPFQVDDSMVPRDPAPNLSNLGHPRGLPMQAVSRCGIIGN